MLRVLALALVATAGAACLPGCSREQGPPDYGGKRPVILISIDSLRADHCTPYGYRPAAGGEVTTPFMARMAEEGVVFENASSVAPWTLPSHVTILSGMHPREHGVRTRKQRIGDGLELISGRMHEAGYATGGFFSGPFLHNVWGFGHGFDVYQPGVAYLANRRAGEQLADAGKSEEVQEIHAESHHDSECAEQVVGKAIRWLDQGERWRKPFFLFLHFWDPHYDYFPPADYRRRFLVNDDGSVHGDELLQEDVPLTDELKRGLQALYDAEIRYTDDWIAKLDAQLQAWGIENDVILLITADHGEEFLEHGNRGHHLTLYEEVTHVPLLVRAPGLAPAGRRVRGTVSLADVAPTLIDLAGVPPWNGRSGRSMRPLWDEADADHQIHLDLLRPTKKIELLGWREGPSKLIVDSPARRAQLFDLDLDPLERAGQTFLAPFGGAPALQKALLALTSEPREPPYRPGDVSEPEHIEHSLSQAGYVGD